MVRYFRVGSSGLPEEITQSEYMELFKNPYVTQFNTSNGVVTVDKITEESEDEDFKER